MPILICTNAVAFLLWRVVFSVEVRLINDGSETLPDKHILKMRLTGQESKASTFQTGVHPFGLPSIFDKMFNRKSLVELLDQFWRVIVGHGCCTESKVTNIK